MMPHDMFAAIVRVLERVGVNSLDIEHIAHEIMDEIEGQP